MSKEISNASDKALSFLHAFYMTFLNRLEDGSEIIQCERKKMGEQEKQSLNETKRNEKAATQEAEQLAKELVRKNAYLIKEEAIEKAAKEMETKRREKQANDEIEQLARDRTRRKALLAREQTIAEAQEARQLKAKK